MIPPPMYTDMKETQFIRWNFEYTEPFLLETFQSIPDELLLVPPGEAMEPPSLVFANFIIKEVLHIQGFTQGRMTIPDRYQCLLRRGQSNMAEKLQAVSDRNDLISLFTQVRKATYAYLDSLSDDQLKQIPKQSILPPDDPNRGNPIREAFVMTIYQQNLVWGKLIATKQALNLPATEHEQWQR